MKLKLSSKRAVKSFSLSGDFVQRILDEAEERQRHYFSVNDRRGKILQIITSICKEENINMMELQSGSRRRPVSQTRSRIAHQLIAVNGVPMAVAARELGVSTPAISKIIRNKDQQVDKFNNVP